MTNSNIHSVLLIKKKCYHSPWYLTVWLLILLLANAPDSNAQLNLDEAYQKNYDALLGVARPFLDLELRATIDAALSAGSYLSPPISNYKRNQIAKDLLRRSQNILCRTASYPPDNVRTACITGTENTAKDLDVHFTPAAVGSIAAVCALLLETDPAKNHCARP